MATFPLRQIIQLSDIISKLVRDNFTDISNWFGDHQNQIDLLLTPPAGNEVTNARDHHSVLRDRLRSASKASGNRVISGLQVTTNNNMTVGVEPGEAIVDGVACVVTARQNSATITAPTNKRYDVIVLNSDNSLAIVSGNDAAEPLMPTVSSTQRALGILYSTSTQTAFSQDVIMDARYQGAVIDGFYFFTVNEAISYSEAKAVYIPSLSGVRGNIGGVIDVGPGYYFEEINIEKGGNAMTIGDKNLTINFDPSAKIYRPTSAKRALRIQGNTNTAGYWVRNVTINGGHFYGNGMSGAIPNISIYRGHVITFNNVWSDGNTSSSLTNGKDITLENVLRFKNRGCSLWDRWWKIGSEVPGIDAPIGMETYLGHTMDYWEAYEVSCIDDIGEPPIGSVIFTQLLAHGGSVPYGYEVCGGTGVTSYASPWRGQAINIDTNDGTTAPWSTFYSNVQNCMRVF